MTKEEKEMNDSDIRESLNFYYVEKSMVHLVLRNRRFYNGKILEIRDNILILDDNKIGKIPIPLKDVYLIESFHEPNNGNNNSTE